MLNLYEQFWGLLPDPPLHAGTVIDPGAGVVTVELPGGGRVRARGLLDAFNEAKQAAELTIVRMLVTGLVLALLAGSFVKLRVFGGGQ